jgi:hypothetical protein
MDTLTRDVVEPRHTAMTRAARVRPLVLGALACLVTAP